MQLPGPPAVLPLMQAVTLAVSFFKSYSWHTSRICIRVKNRFPWKIKRCFRLVRGTTKSCERIIDEKRWHCQVLKINFNHFHITKKILLFYLICTFLFVIYFSLWYNIVWKKKSLFFTSIILHARILIIDPRITANSSKWLITILRLLSSDISIDNNAIDE